MEAEEVKYEPAANEQGDVAKGKEKGWKVEDLRIRAAENGFTVSASYCREPKKSKGNGSSPGRDYKSEDYVFESIESALEKIHELSEEFK